VFFYEDAENENGVQGKPGNPGFALLYKILSRARLSMKTPDVQKYVKKQLE
jgi:hypothetical protein